MTLVSLTTGNERCQNRQDTVTWHFMSVCHVPPKTKCPQINFSTPPWKDLIFLLRQHCSSFSLRRTTSKTTPERNSTTGAWAVKVPFPRPTTLKELFHKDQSPKLNSHHLWEGLTAGGRRGRSGQSEGTETCHRKARGTKASIATPCPIDPWTGSSNANCYKPIFMWNVSFWADKTLYRCFRMKHWPHRAIPTAAQDPGTRGCCRGASIRARKWEHYMNACREQ